VARAREGAAVIAMPARLECVFLGHALMFERGRDATGRPVQPSTLHWTCSHCGAELGSTVFVPFAPLQATQATGPVVGLVLLLVAVLALLVWLALWAFRG
jgi:hypothetical protein